MTRMTAFEQRTGLKPSIVADCLRDNTKRFEAKQTASRVANASAATTFTIGQQVARKNSRHDISEIVAINGGMITTANGRKFVASMLIAV